MIDLGPCRRPRTLPRPSCRGPIEQPSPKHSLVFHRERALALPKLGRKGERARPKRCIGAEIGQKEGISPSPPQRRRARARGVAALALPKPVWPLWSLLSFIWPCRVASMCLGLARGRVVPHDTDTVIRSCNGEAPSNVVGSAGGETRHTHPAASISHRAPSWESRNLNQAMNLRRMVVDCLDDTAGGRRHGCPIHWPCYHRASRVGDGRTTTGHEIFRGATGYDLHCRNAAVESSEPCLVSKDAAVRRAPTSTGRAPSMQTAGEEASGMEREAQVTGVEARGRGIPRLETASKRAHPLPSQLPLPGHGWHGLGGRLSGQEVGVVLVVKMAVCRSSQVVLFL